MALTENVFNRYKSQTLENANQNVLYDFQVKIDNTDITEYVISVSSIPSYSISMENVQIGNGLLELNFPSSLSVVGTLSLTILDSHDFKFYKGYVYKYFINQKIFTITLTITNLGKYTFYG